MNDTTVAALTQEEETATNGQTARAELINKVKNFISKVGMSIKVTATGNIHVYSALFNCWSVDKQKTYAGGINVDPQTLRALCTNEPLQKEIVAFLDLLPDSVGMTREERDLFAKDFNKPSKSKKK